MHRMPPHGGCCEGHEHDESLDDDLGLSLRPYIDLDHVVCLNEEVPHSGKGILKFHDDRLSSHPYVKSNDEDPELLLTIPFTEGVTVKSIAVRSNSIEGVEGSPPLKLKVIGNRGDTMDFETARELQHGVRGHQCVDLLLVRPEHFPEGTVDYPLRPAGPFQNITSLTILVCDNYAGTVQGDGVHHEDDEISTLITYLGLKGRGTGSKRQAVETVYESRGMKKDHQVKGNEYGASQLL